MSAKRQTNLVAHLQEQVQTAKGLQALPDRALLDDAETNPAMVSLRSRLSQRRQRRALKHEHRSELRRQRRTAFDQGMDEAGHRLIRKRELADSPARRAANLARLQRWVIIAAVPAVIGLGAASTAGVHAFMATYAGAAAWAAWGLEPAIILLVSGVIIARSVMLRSGAAMPSSVTWIERGALAASILMNFFGAGIGAVVAPVGAAVVALVVERILAAIAVADVHRPGAAATTVAEAEQPARASAQTGAGAVEETERDALYRSAEADLRAEAAEGVSAAEDYLARTDGHRSHGRSHGDGEETEEPKGGQFSASERHVSGPRSHGEGAERSLSAPERRRREGERNLRRVLDYLCEHPGAPTPEVARAVGLGASTVRRLRRALDGGRP